MTRPLGYPPTPSAMSSVIEPVGMTGMSFTSVLFMRMIDPLPKSFSIFSITAFKTFSLSGFVCAFSAIIRLFFFDCLFFRVFPGCFSFRRFTSRTSPVSGDSGSSCPLFRIPFRCGLRRR